MAAGVIPYSSIPNPVPAGLLEACESALVAAGFSPTVTRAPDGVHVSDVAVVTSTIANYVGSAAQVAFAKSNAYGAGLLDRLTVLLRANAQLDVMIMAGNSSALTGASVSAFLATTANNYRTLRAAINAATTMAQLAAININAGWPSNP